MPRIDMETYHKGFFGSKNNFDREELRAVNYGHVVSSRYYDLKFGRNALTYRDKENNLTISIEHDTIGNIAIYFDSFISENLRNLKNITPEILKKRIINGLNFLCVKHNFE